MSPAGQIPVTHDSTPPPPIPPPPPRLQQTWPVEHAAPFTHTARIGAPLSATPPLLLELELLLLDPPPELLLLELLLDPPPELLLLELPPPPELLDPLLLELELLPAGVEPPLLLELLPAGAEPPLLLELLPWPVPTLVPPVLAGGEAAEPPPSHPLHAPTMAAPTMPTSANEANEANLAVVMPSSFARDKRHHGSILCTVCTVAGRLVPLSRSFAISGDFDHLERRGADVLAFASLRRTTMEERARASGPKGVVAWSRAGAVVTGA